MRTLLILITVFISTLVQAKNNHYVFYLHGAIVEGTTEDPSNSTYGKYEYAGIVKTLKDKGYVVFSEVRPANTDVQAYAKKIKQQIDSLKKTGIASADICVIGASKGALITMLVSGLVKDKNVKYVVMAACNDGNRDSFHPDLYGQILSIYEKSDGIGRSCETIKLNSKGISRYKEVEINTGLGHGFLYKPLKAWMQPAEDWIVR
jgi:hypothetical protein